MTKAEHCRVLSGLTAWPVFVPTKGRAGRVSAAVLSLSPTLVVEETEAPLYEAAYPDVEIKAFGPCGQGVAFARNTAKNLASGLTDGWFHMLDDDLSEFFQAGAQVASRGVGGLPAPRGAPVEVPATTALRALEDVVVETEKAAVREGLGGPGVRLAMAGLPVYWRKDALDGERRWNVHCYCAVALHAWRLGAIWYDQGLPLKEDTDFVLAVLSNGWTTLRVHTHAFQMPLCGLHPGGLFGVYESGVEREAAERLAGKWPELVKLGPKGKKPKVLWEKFALSAEGEQEETVPVSPCAPYVPAPRTAWLPVLRVGKR